MADDSTDPRRTDLDPGPDSDVEQGLDADLDENFPAPRDLAREAALVSAGLAVLAAVLCVLAPFRAVYTLRASGISASFDGWGRYDLAAASQHGPRYGVALTLAALVLVVAAASRLRDLRPLEPADELPGGPSDEPLVSDEPAPRTGDDRLAAGVGIAGSALLLGVLGSVALSIESTESNADSIAAAGGTATSVDVGAMLWLLVGAWVVSMLSLYVPWFEARRRG